MCTCALNDILRACFAKCSLCVAQTSEFSHPPTPPKSVGWQVVSHARRLKTGTMRPTYRRLPMLAAKQGLCCRMFLILHSCASMSGCTTCRAQQYQPQSVKEADSGAHTHRGRLICQMISMMQTPPARQTCALRHDELEDCSCTILTPNPLYVHQPAYSRHERAQLVLKCGAGVRSRANRPPLHPRSAWAGNH